MTRREIRDKIFKILFTAEFNAPDEMSEQIDLAFDTEMPGDEEDDPMLYASVPDMHDFGGGSELPPYSAAFWKMEH